VVSPCGKKFRASIAIAKSFDLLKAITNIGMIKELNALPLSKKLPLLKSTPLLAWAFKILLDSSTNDGTKRIDNDKIVAHSLTGALNNFKG
jgi:hypothetical protein